MAEKSGLNRNFTQQGNAFSVDGPVTADEVGTISRLLHPEMEGCVTPRSGAGSDTFYQGKLDSITVAPGINVVVSDVRTESEGRTQGRIPRSSSVLMVLNGTALTTSLSGCRDITLRPFYAAVVNVRDTALLSNNVVAGQKFESVMVQTDPYQISDCALQSELLTITERTAAHPLVLPPETWRRAGKLLSMSQNSLIRKLKAESLAFEVIASVLADKEYRLKYQGYGMSRRDRTALHQARDIMLNAPFQPHTLNSLARDIGMSRATLKRKFPKLFEKSPISYLRDTRLDRAHLGLDAEGWSVSYAARQAGFKHASNFSTAFRKRFGISPGAVGKY